MRSPAGFLSADYADAVRVDLPRRRAALPRFSKFPANLYIRRPGFRVEFRRRVGAQSRCADLRFRARGPRGKTMGPDSVFLSNLRFAFGDRGYVHGHRPNKVATIKARGVSKQSDAEVSLAISREAGARDFSVDRVAQMSAALQRPTADCSRTALRRLACVARLDGLRAGHPPFPRRRRQGQHDDHDRLARHHAGDRGPDNRRNSRFRMVVPVVQFESALSARFYLFRPDRTGYLVYPVDDDHAPGRRGLARLARPRSGTAAASQTRRRSRSRPCRSTGNGCSSTPTTTSQP